MLSTDNRMHLSTDIYRVMLLQQPQGRIQRVAHQVIIVSQMACVKANLTTSARRTFSGGMDVQIPHGKILHAQSIVKG